MQTNIPGVFAAGDAVTFPLAWRNNRRVNIPHWQMAHAQGTGGRPGMGLRWLPDCLGEGKGWAAMNCWPGIPDVSTHSQQAKPWVLSP